MNHTPEYRIDAEYFKKQNLCLYKILTQHEHDKIKDFAYVTDGIHASIDFDDDSDINLLSAKAPKENFFDLSGTHYISALQHKNNPRTQLKENDIIISTVGTIGNVAVVDSSILPANSDRHVGIIRIEKDFHPRFVSTFLLSKYGRFQTNREIAGNVQPNLYIFKIKELVIPRLSETFQLKIENLVSKTCILKNEATDILTKAQTLLLRELGLENYKPKHQTVYTKNLSEVFEAKRMDAEYFQPKYADIEHRIKNYKGGYSRIFDGACSLHDKNYTPEDNKEYSYIELSNISSVGEISSIDVMLGKNLPSRARRKVYKNQLIVSSIEGSLESIAIIPENLNHALCSTGFYVIEEQSINIETLFVFLKSTAGQMQLKRACKGTILTAFSKDEFSKVIIPNIPQNIQAEIAKNIQSSNEARRQSRKLLDIAKQAVEIAIEQNEQVATDFIKGECEKIGVSL